MKPNRLLCTLLATSVSATSIASGFALYEHSALSHAMGGALVGKAMDASANLNNPATLTDLTNVTVTAGFVTEHPRGRADVRRRGTPYHEEKMDPGLFWLPHLQLAVPLPADFTFGLGISAEYGLGTDYGDEWLMNWSAQETTIQGLVINPNLAYRITDDWSVGAGLRWLFFDFEQYSRPQVAKDVPGLGTVDFGRFDNHLEGDNEWKSLGWQVGTKYDVTKTFSIGAVYKSAIDVTVKGKTSNTMAEYHENLKSTMVAGLYGMSVADFVRRQAAVRCGKAEADLTLPQSVTFGANWDVLPTWHLGTAVSWTEWSEFDTLHFDLEGGDKDTPLDWRDTWRVSVGSCWEFCEGWKWLVSYTYDMDSTTSDQQSAMLPPADRHILATGLSWNAWGGIELTVSYACIFMDGREMSVKDALGDVYDFNTKWGFCHAGGFSATYRF